MKSNSRYFYQIAKAAKYIREALRSQAVFGQKRLMGSHLKNNNKKKRKKLRQSKIVAL